MQQRRKERIDRGEERRNEKEKKLELRNKNKKGLVKLCNKNKNITNINIQSKTDNFLKMKKGHQVKYQFEGGSFEGSRMTKSELDTEKTNCRVNSSSSTVSIDRPGMEEMESPGQREITGREGLEIPVTEIRRESFLSKGRHAEDTALAGWKAYKIQKHDRSKAPSCRVSTHFYVK